MITNKFKETIKLIVFSPSLFIRNKTIEKVYFENICSEKNETGFEQSLLMDFFKRLIALKDIIKPSNVEVNDFRMRPILLVCQYNYIQIPPAGK